MDLNSIEALPFGIRSPIYEVLRILRLNLQAEYYEKIPKLGFKLIRREDIYKNLKLYNKNTQKSLPLFLKKYDLSDTINNIIRGTKKK